MEQMDNGFDEARSIGEQGANGSEAWVTPSFERIPLNEATNSAQVNAANDGAVNYS